MPLCNTPFVTKVHSARFAGFPPRDSSPECREAGGVQFDPFPPPARSSQARTSLLLHVDAGLAQQLSDRVALQSRGVEQHAHRPFFLVKLDALDAIDLADTVNGPQLSFSRRSLVAVGDFEVRHFHFSQGIRFEDYSGESNMSI